MISCLNRLDRTEHIQQGEKHDAEVRNLAASLQGAQDSVEPIRIPQLAYHEVNLNGSSYERALLKRLKCWSLT